MINQLGRIFLVSRHHSSQLRARARIPNSKVPNIPFVLLLFKFWIIGVIAILIVIIIPTLNLQFEIMNVSKLRYVDTAASTRLYGSSEYSEIE
jgi:hypothetical protein